MGEFLGQTLSDWVTSQINVRKELLNKRKFSEEANSLLHGSAPYVTLYSSVESGVSSTKYSASDFTIEGGLAFKKDSFYRTPVGYRPDGSDGRGFTPRPGIIGAQIKSKGTFGTLRDVEITLKAFNKDDIDIIFELYCRPGFSFLLEWGHTIFRTSKKTAPVRPIGPRDEFFSTGATHISVQAAIQQARKDTEGNYDAIIGICKNYSWSFNSDGSYDITLSFASKGEVIESLKTSFDPGITETDLIALAKGNVDKSERKSPLHYFSKRLELASKSGQLVGADCKAAIAETSPKFAAVLDERYLETWCAPGFDIKQPDSFFDKDTVFIYMSLRTVCSVLQSAAIMSEGKGQKALNIRLKEGNKYFTHRNHYSINPFVCVIPNLSDENDEFESKPAKQALHSDLTSYLSKYPDDVLSICVSNQYLYEKLDAIYDDDQESENEPGLLDIFKSILGGINEALGGINELDVTYDEETNEWSIVDRKCRLPQAAKKPAELDLVGLGSFAYDFKTESKITNKLVNQISIAAQGTNTGTKQDVKELIQWNRGHRDRLTPIKTDKPADKADELLTAAYNAAAADADFLKAYGEWKDRGMEAFEKFNGTAMFTDQQYDPDLFQGLLSGHQTYQAKLASEVCISEGEQPPGPLPMELSFKLYGLSGFKIGEVFKLASNTVKVLPNAYSNETVGFIVTKVDHSIDENGWQSEIGAMMYNLSKLEKGSTSFLKGAGSATAGTAVKQENPVSTQGNSSTQGGTDILRTQTALGTNVQYDKVKAAVQKKKYQWFEGELELNIVGVRNTSGQRAANPPGRGVLHPITNKFNDIIIVAWVENGQKFAESYPATTVPGAGYTLATNKKFNPSGNNPNGTGTMFEKQYINQYTVGFHSNHGAKPHRALRSVKAQTAHRDKEYRDNWIDLAVTPRGKHGTTAGLFEDGGGMQIHNSGEYYSTNKTVDNWSAGCQVFANPDQHRRLMALVDKSQKKTKRGTFSYTLINDKEIQL